MFSTWLGGLVIGLLVGGVAMVFVYRNNQKVIGKYADRVDKLVDTVEQLTGAPIEESGDPFKK